MLQAAKFISGSGIIWGAYWCLPELYGFKQTFPPIVFTFCLIGAALSSLIAALILHPIRSCRFWLWFLYSTIVCAWLGVLAVYEVCQDHAGPGPRWPGSPSDPQWPGFVAILLCPLGALVSGAASAFLAALSGLVPDSSRRSPNQ